jgi:DNA processing protein
MIWKRNDIPSTPVDPQELAAWLRLTLTPGVGNSSARKLLAAFGLPQTIFEQGASALKQVVSSQQVEALLATPAELPALLTTTLDWLAKTEEGGIRHRVVALGDSGYPSTLLTLHDPPLMLYLLGSGNFLENDAPAHIDRAQGTINSEACRRTIDCQMSLAVVGSRNPTPQGAANARAFSRAMTQAGLTVVSGLALGIDGAAHEGALAGALEGANTCATLAVVGTGLDRVYPRAHRELAHRIAANGLLISEYPLGTPPLTANFPKRNRLICGLSRGTLVVEAALKSGSLITARLASEQGKEVFAVPGSIHAAQSRGCHALIKQGAKLVESAQDILEELHWGSASAALQTQGASDSGVNRADLKDESGLLEALGFDPVGLDALQARCGLDAAQLQAQLMTLELDGYVSRLPGGLFQRLYVD